MIKELHATLLLLHTFIVSWMINLGFIFVKLQLHLKITILSIPSCSIRKNIVQLHWEVSISIQLLQLFLFSKYCQYTLLHFFTWLLLLSNQKLKYHNLQLSQCQIECFWQNNSLLFRVLYAYIMIIIIG